MERPAVLVGAGGLEPVRHQGVKSNDGVRAPDHAEPQCSWSTPWWKGTDAPERQLERRLSDVLAQAFNDRGADGVGRVAGEGLRQVHEFRVNDLQPASAVTQRGDDRRLFGRDGGTCVVRQINGRENAHEIAKCPRPNGGRCSLSFAAGSVLRR